MSGETGSELVTFDPFDWQTCQSIGLGGDTTPTSSRHSSYGESEFDRYCSANSALNTPSMRSVISVFNDCPSDFGSLKSYGITDDNGLENFTLGGKSDINHNNHRLFGLSESVRDRAIGISPKNQDDRLSCVKYGSSGFELYGNDDGELEMLGEGMSRRSNNEVESFGASSVLVGDNICGTGRGECSVAHTESSLVKTVKDSVQNVSARELGSTFNGACESHLPRREDDLDGLNTHSTLQFGEGYVEEEVGNLSDQQHSESEDSMYDYGIDDDNKKQLGLPKMPIFKYSVQERKTNNENPLLINSSIAFGSEDWDDFALESELNAQNFQNLDPFQNNSELERNKLTPISVSRPTNCAEVVNKEIEVDAKNINFVLKNDKDVKDVLAAYHLVEGSDELPQTTKVSSETQIRVSNITNLHPEDSREIDVPENREQIVDRFVNSAGSSNFQTAVYHTVNPQLEDAREIHTTKSHEQDAETFLSCSRTSSGADNCKLNRDLAVEEALVKIGMDENEEPHCSNRSLASDSISIAAPSQSVEALVEDEKANIVQSKIGIKKTLTSLPALTDPFEKIPVATEADNFEPNEFFDEVVHEMEEILLDSVDSPAARFSIGDNTKRSDISIPLRDGGLTASTSGPSYEYSQVQRPMRIDGVEVVGARQKRGNVSFSERLVGVKEYTVYKIRVVSGKDQWEVERRYRDFLILYRRVKAHFAEKGWDLPSAWRSVEKRSGKIFGSASPDIVADRSILIQECLQSLLHARVFSSLPSALPWFLSPQESCPSSPLSGAPLAEAVSQGSDATNIKFLSLGTMISLNVEIQPYKSMKQMLEAQHYTCAGCHKHFDDGNTLIWDFVQSFGWGKPRRCEYTGQLFCSSCHTNDSAVLPARVLHHWDFSQYPVSQLAKFYLDSIHDKPMLCVSAVNPFLFSKVPTLLHVMGLRRKIGAMIPYVHCPFRGSINRGLGSRRYLLESNDFFALRDLIDLSKGPFAALPVMLDTVSTKILQHITEQCLICCDVGIACGARQDCSDPSSLIFPFQEDEVEKCASCGSVLHKSCYKKLGTCSCKAHSTVNEKMNFKIVSRHEGGETRADWEMGKIFGSGLAHRFLSGLLMKQKSETYVEQKHNENTILMGSLPSTSL